MASSSTPGVDRAAETEATVRQMLERAAATKHRDPNGALRKDVLKRLTMHAKSPYSAVKRLVADNLRYFFRDFPQLEDDVINAVYDLCEDADQTVRLSGYRAIVELSREDPKWTKRNTDVLLQLLQSDDPIELDVITHALIDHINIDASAALAVMCDHCVAQSHDTVLRRLVLDFFIGQGRKPILEHMRGPQDEAESVFRQGLLKVLQRVPPAEAAVLVERLLLPLRSYAPGSVQRAQLLASFLEPCRMALRTDLHNAGQPISLPTALPTLETACKLPGAPLLQIFKDSLITRGTLPRLEPKTQLRVLEYYVATVTSNGVSDAERELALEEDAALVLETLDRVGSSDLKQVWPILAALARALAERGVPPPAAAVPALRALQSRAEEEPRAQASEAIRLIKTALNPPPVPGRRPSIAQASLKRKLGPDGDDEPPKPRGLFAHAIAQATNTPDAGRLTKRIRSASSSASISSSAPASASSSSAPSTPQPIRPLVARIQGAEVRDGARKSAPPTLLARMLGDGGLKARISGRDSAPRVSPLPVSVAKTGSSLLDRMGDSMQIDSFGSAGDVGRRKIRVHGRR